MRKPGNGISFFMMNKNMMLYRSTDSEIMRIGKYEIPREKKYKIPIVKNRANTA